MARKEPDHNSVIADPQFVDAASPEAGLKPTSSAIACGYRPVDAAAIGLYGEKDWVDAPAAIKRTALPISKVFEPKPTFEDYENIKPGYMPPNTMAFGVVGKATIAVTTRLPRPAQRASRLPIPKAHTNSGDRRSATFPGSAKAWPASALTSGSNPAPSASMTGAPTGPGAASGRASP